MRRLVVSAIVAGVVASCGGLEEPGDTSGTGLPTGAISIVANADLAVGRSRLLVAVAESDGGRLGSPDQKVAIEVAPSEQPQMRQRTDGIFTWIIEDGFGLYRAEVDFDRPGAWNVTVVPEFGRPLTPSIALVGEDTTAPDVGDLAPAVATPTVGESALKDITTDPEPDPRFYQMSLDEAVKSGETTVVVFSTPGYCLTATCGPMLEQAKVVARGYPDVNFIHAEIYLGFHESDFVPDSDHLAPSVTAWNLPSEPWIFVVDGRGMITHRFEGVMDPTELESALG